MCAGSDRITVCMCRGGRRHIEGGEKGRHDLQGRLTFDGQHDRLGAYERLGPHLLSVVMKPFSRPPAKIKVQKIIII